MGDIKDKAAKTKDAAAHAVHEVPDKVQNIAAAGESVVGKTFSGQASLGTKYGTLSIGDHTWRLSIGFLYGLLWFCFACLVLSNVGYALAYWDRHRHRHPCKRLSLRSIFFFIVYSLDLIAWMHSSVALCVVIVLMQDAARLQKLFQENFHSEGSTQNGSLIYDVCIVFVFSTCQVVISALCFWYGVIRNEEGQHSRHNNEYNWQPRNETCRHKSVLEKKNLYNMNGRI